MLTFHLCLCIGQLVCQLTGCFVVTCVRVKVLTVLLTLSSKPRLSSEPAPHSGLCVIINPCSALYTAPNYGKASMRSRRSLLCVTLTLTERERRNRKKKGRVIRNLVCFPLPLSLGSISPCFICMFQKLPPITEAVPPTASPSTTRGVKVRGCVRR